MVTPGLSPQRRRRVEELPLNLDPVVTLRHLRYPVICATP